VSFSGSTRVMIARGFTGQTTENFALDYKLGHTGRLPVPGIRLPGPWVCAYPPARA